MASRLILTAVAGVSLLGCTEPEPVAPSPAVPLTRRAQLVSDEAPARLEPDRTPPFHLLKFELESAGSGPRGKLRYRPQEGYAVRASAASTTDVDGTVAQIETGLAISRRKSGRVTVVGLPAAETAHPGAAAYAQLIAGKRAIVDVSDRGLLLELDGSASLASNREIAAMLLRHLAPLPAQEVGRGARWRVVYAIARGGVFIKFTSHYELLRVEGNRIELAISSNDSAEPQPIMVEKKLIGDLVGLKATATGVFEVDLHYPVIRRGTLHAKSTFHAQLKNQPALFREAETKTEIASASAN